MEYVGWVGSILLAVCAFPQALKSIIDKNSDGLSSWFLLMWGLGEILVFVYILPDRQYPLIANYGMNLILVAIITWYKVFPKR